MNDTADEPPAMPAVILYTMAPESRAPRAAWFGMTVKATALLRAERQGFSTIEIAESQIDLVKAALEEGDGTGSGRVTLPPVKRDVLVGLLATLAGSPPGPSADAVMQSPIGPGNHFVGLSDDIQLHEVPVDPLWTALSVNMVVLVPEYADKGIPSGWWEAVIVAIHGDVYTVRFRDYPRQELKKRRRDEIAIMYPPPARV